VAYKNMVMKRKIKITICSLLMFVSFNALAQSGGQTTLQKLMDETWVMIFNNTGDWSFKQNYTTTLINEALYYQGNTTSSICNFYLSNQIETTFDYSKVGNVQNGKYIVTVDELFGESIINVYEILRLEDYYMDLKSMKSGEIFNYTAK
jgi:hypothetical protein